MGKQKRLEVDNTFIQALQEKFEAEQPKLKSSITKYTWKKQLAYLLNNFIQKELVDLDVDLHDRVYHKENNEWPSYKTIERMMVTDKKAILDLLQVCGWYVFGAEWKNKRNQFSFLKIEIIEDILPKDEIIKTKITQNTTNNIKTTKIKAKKDIDIDVGKADSNIEFEDLDAGGSIRININQD